jgi:hypothetical protein
MEILCINDSFKERVYYINNIVLPIEGKIYSLREIVTNRNGKKGILLNEIYNSTKIKDVEVNFAMERFTDLMGNPINENIKLNIYENRVSKDEILYL